MKTNPTCNTCGVELNDENWSHRMQKKGNYICKECNTEKNRVYRENNSDKIKASNKLYRENNLDKIKASNKLYLENNHERVKDSQRLRQRLYRENNPEKSRAYQRSWAENNPDKVRAGWTKGNRKRGNLPMKENKECSSYLGVHINERLLRHYFNDVEVMPYGNHGYDFICNNGKKIDGKSSCSTKGGRWLFNIKHNIISDFFFCVAYDNREDLNPLHIWMLPGEKFNHRSSASIRPTTIHKWDEYKQDIMGVIICCEEIKSE